MTTQATGGPVPAEQAAREADLVRRVRASFDGAGDERLKQLMQALVEHLHAFVREVRLSEDEWQAAIDFLTDAGHITDERRQEFILLSDVLGLSMQTITIGNEAYGDATEATVVGPFFVEGSPERPARRRHQRGRAGPAVLGRGNRPRHRRPAGPARADRGVGGRRGRPVRRAARRRARRPAAPTCTPTTTAATASGR